MEYVVGEDDLVPAHGVHPALKEQYDHRDPGMRHRTLNAHEGVVRRPGIQLVPDLQRRDARVTPEVILDAPEVVLHHPPLILLDPAVRRDEQDNEDNENRSANLDHLDGVASEIVHDRSVQLVAELYCIKAREGVVDGLLQQLESRRYELVNTQFLTNKQNTRLTCP